MIDILVQKCSECAGELFGPCYMGELKGPHGDCMTKEPIGQDGRDEPMAKMCQSCRDCLWQGFTGHDYQLAG